jgi:calcium/calmodulin-dependent protein kinase I
VSKIITNEKMSTQVGTPSYFAPEVLSGNGYNNSVDYWSIGVILYILLCGYPPFSEDSNEMLYEKIKRGEYDFPEEDWKEISPSAKDLVKKLLVVNSTQRYKANEIMTHPWIKQDKIPNGHLPLVASKMKSYNNVRKMIRTKNAIGFLHKLSTLRKEKSPGKK